MTLKRKSQLKISDTPVEPLFTDCMLNEFDGMDTFNSDFMLPLAIVLSYLMKCIHRDEINVIPFFDMLHYSSNIN